MRLSLTNGVRTRFSIVALRSLRTSNHRRGRRSRAGIRRADLAFATLFSSAIVGEFPGGERRFVRPSGRRKRRHLLGKGGTPERSYSGVITERCWLNCLGPSEQPEADPVSRHVPVHPALGWMHRVSSGPLHSTEANLSGVNGFLSTHRRSLSGLFAADRL